MKCFTTFMMCCVAIGCLADSPQPPAPSEPDGEIGGHEYVDLGLPSGTLWATCNIGADSPYEKGLYFAWGEVEPKEDFTWENYRFFEGYESDPNNGEWIVLEDIGTDISGTRYDAARHQWGGTWRMPNEQERYELLMMCWCNGPAEENGVRGARIYGPNGNSIFLPVCGFGLWYGEEDPFNSTDGAYWTGVEEPEYGFNGRPIEPSNVAKSMGVDSSGFTGASSRKAYGLNIRAVINPQESGIGGVTPDCEEVSLTYRDGRIHVDGAAPGGTLKVYALSGRLIFSGVITDGASLPEGISHGTYIVSYTDSQKMVSTKKLTI